MAGSGVAVMDEVPVALKEVQMDHKYRYVIIRLTDDLTKVVVEKKADKSATYDDFIADLQAAESQEQCRYAIYDYNYKTKSGADKDKLAFFSWSPDCAKVKQKMLYSSSKDAVKKSLGNAIGINIQATDYDEVSEERLLSEIQKFDKA